MAKYQFIEWQVYDEGGALRPEFVEDPGNPGRIGPITENLRIVAVYAPVHTVSFDVQGTAAPIQYLIPQDITPFIREVPDQGSITVQVQEEVEQ